MATRWNSKHTGQKIDDTIDYVTNPNLLDNWYLGNAVNQRGKTEYAGTMYGIDRWRCLRGTVVVATDALELIPIANGTTYLYQLIEKPGKYIGQVVTFSILLDTPAAHLSIRWATSNNTTYMITESNTAGERKLLTGSFVVTDTFANVGVYIPSTDPANKARIYAVKLELGSQQTLAHQDVDGNWVLNEIPNYGEQLARCQRHLFVPTTQTDSIYNLAIGVGTSTTTITFFLPLPTTMRAKSSITFSGLHAANEINSMLAITKVANYGQVYNGVWLHATVASGAEVGKAYYLRTSNPWSLVLDANL